MNIAYLLDFRHYRYGQGHAFQIVGHNPLGSYRYPDTHMTEHFGIGTAGFIFRLANFDSYMFVSNKMQCCSTDALTLKIFIENEEEIIMGKRVGSFINPTTGEEDWLEPETISMIVLAPKMVTRVGEVNQSAIEYKLTATPDEDHILLTAEYAVNGITYKSQPVSTPSEEFANNWAPLVYSDRALDEADMIKAAKDVATRDLTSRLMDNGILMGGMQFAGAGYVFVNNDKVMSLEVIDFEYSVNGSTPVNVATIRNVVSPASLANLDSPEVRLWTGTHLVTLVNPKIIPDKAKEGQIKEYQLNIAEILVAPDTTRPDFEVINVNELKTDDQVDAYVESRKAFLSDLTGSDEEMDDRFNELF